MQTDSGGPAFPTEPRGPVYGSKYDGMTLRAYAAIHLQQPDSGIDWLDAMILSAKRDAIAGQVLAGLSRDVWPDDPSIQAREAYKLADAMLAERSK